MQNKIQSAPTIFYPESDGKPIAETEIQRDLMIDFIQTLKDYFIERIEDAETRIEDAETRAQAETTARQEAEKRADNAEVALAEALAEIERLNQDR